MAGEISGLNPWLPKAGDQQDKRRRTKDQFPATNFFGRGEVFLAGNVFNRLVLQGSMFRILPLSYRILVTTNCRPSRVKNRRRGIIKSVIHLEPGLPSDLASFPTPWSVSLDN